MMYRYCCPNCGREIKEEEVLINIAPLVFAGAKSEDVKKIGLFFPLKDFESIINQSDTKGEIKLSLRQILEIAYDEKNIEELAAHTGIENAEQAMTAFIDSVRVMKQRPKQIQERLDAIRKEKEIVEQEEGKKKQETEVKKKAGLDFAFDVFHKDEESQLSILQQEEAKLIEELNRKEYWRKIQISGFDEVLVRQIIENISDFQMSMEKDDYLILCSELAINEDFGYTGSVKGNSVEGGGRFCPYCKAKGKILAEAFRRRQFTIGLVGTQNVGKSCLIAALVNYLMSTRGGALDMPCEEWDKQYRKGFLDPYRSGRKTAKTQGLGENCFNPSVRTTSDRFIWTFIDVAGEAIQDKQTKRFSPQRIMNSFESVLRCDAYVFCVSQDSLKETGAYGEINTIFTQFIRMLKPEKRKPILLTLTQIDCDDVIQHTNTDVPGWNDDEYLYKRDSRFMVDEGMLPIMQAIGDYVYCTAFTSSAYGGEPLEIDSDEFKDLAPRHIDWIIDWVLKQNAILPVEGFADAEQITLDGTILNRHDLHQDGDTVRFISRMFYNPTKDDLAFWEADNGSFIAKIKLFFLKFGKRIEKKKLLES